MTGEPSPTGGTPLGGGPRVLGALRSVTLIVCALAFVAIAIGNVVDATRMAAGIGLSPLSPDGTSELFAVYVGLWLVHAVLFVAAWRRPGDVTLQVVVALLLTGQVVGRVVALARGGVPSVAFAPMIAAETVGAAVLWLSFFAARRALPNR